MASRGINTINALVDRAKAHVFGEMMTYGSLLSKGVSPTPSLERISNLIWACESEYSTLDQKNVFADMIAESGDDVVGPNGVFSNNVFQNGF